MTQRRPEPQTGMPEWAMQQTAVAAMFPQTLAQAQPGTRPAGAPSQPTAGGSSHQQLLALYQQQQQQRVMAQTLPSPSAYTPAPAQQRMAQSLASPLQLAQQAEVQHIAPDLQPWQRPHLNPPSASLPDVHGPQAPFATIPPLTAQLPHHVAPPTILNGTATAQWQGAAVTATSAATMQRSSQQQALGTLSQQQLLALYQQQQRRRQEQGLATVPRTAHASGAQTATLARQQGGSVRPPY